MFLDLALEYNFNDFLLDSRFDISCVRINQLSEQPYAVCIMKHLQALG